MLEVLQLKKKNKQKTTTQVSKWEKKIIKKNAKIFPKQHCEITIYTRKKTETHK